MLIDRGHKAMIEHESLTVKFICDRGVSHELCRHRICSFAQESTRYVSSGERESLPLNTEDEIIYAYEQGMSMKKISQKNGNMTEWEVYKLLEKNDIKKRNVGSRGVINENFFLSINTPEKSYLLGFMQADGSIRRDLDQVVISQKDDEQWWILNLIRDFIQPDAKTLSIHNKNICRDLYNKGLIPNKTYEMTQDFANLMWDSVSEYGYQYDFIRGLLDGDGSIRWFYQKESSLTQSCNIQFAGNKEIIELVGNFINKDLNYSAKIKQDSNSECLYRYTVTDSNIGKLLCEKMYKNFKFPYGHSKTHRYFNAFNIEIPINYSQINNKKFYIIKPSFFNDKSLWIWGSSMLNSEITYRTLIENGVTPQEARSVLPNSLKTEVVMTANLREWRHFFKLRTSSAAHPQMREITIPLLNELKEKLPEIFNDIEVK